MSESSLFISQVEMVWLLLHGNINFFLSNLKAACVCILGLEIIGPNKQ